MANKHLHTFRARNRDFSNRAARVSRSLSRAGIEHSQSEVASLLSCGFTPSEIRAIIDKPDLGAAIEECFA